MPPKDDLQGLREILRETVGALRLSNCEDRLGLGHSTSKKILDGEIELRVRHLLALARLLDIHPGTSSTSVSKPGPPADLSEDLAEAIRALIRKELAATGLEPAPKKPRKKYRAEYSGKR